MTIKTIRQFLTGKLPYLLAGVLILALLLGIVRESRGASFPKSEALPTATLNLTSAPTQTPAIIQLPPFISQTVTDTLYLTGITRRVDLHTFIPDRPRFDISHYQVVAGDTIFGVADKFQLKPSTILWSNLDVLGDDPHNLRPGQDLVILPEDGAYYQWHAQDSMVKVASYFHVKPEDILNYPGNHLDTKSLGDLTHPAIVKGTWLIVPGGKRDFISWSAPFIPRSNPAVARIYGAGACGKVLYGAMGTGTFVWPTTEHWISGFDYDPSANHPAIDIAGHLGNPIYAADTGVVVYAGWNNWGYGNVIVIDHGNGWQTLYAHLSVIGVACGESVYQGGLMGKMGSTGNSTGPHLHFEMTLNGSHVNPHLYLPPP